ncbi:MAG: hypothetical protein ACFFEK_11650 [Candidatus Thorarchaeota archaeon]
MEVVRISTYPNQKEQEDLPCAWCGRPFTPSIFGPLNTLTYCSYRCASAGEIYTLTCVATLLTGASIYLTGYQLELVIGSPYGVPVLFLFWGVAVPFWCMVYIGYRERTIRRSEQKVARNGEQ